MRVFAFLFVLQGISGRRRRSDRCDNDINACIVKEMYFKTRKEEKVKAFSECIITFLREGNNFRQCRL